MNTVNNDSAGAIAPPPLIFATAIALGWLLEQIWPWSSGQSTAQTIAGISLIGLAFGLATLCFRSFRRNDTAANPYSSTNSSSSCGP